MSKKERVKTKLSLLKALIIAFLTAFFGAMSFTALYYDKISTEKLIFAFCGIITLLVLLGFLAFTFNKELDKLEKL